MFIDYLGIIFICVMSTNCLWLVGLQRLVDIIDNVDKQWWE